MLTQVRTQLSVISKNTYILVTEWTGTVGITVFRYSIYYKSWHHRLLQLCGYGSPAL